jgi:hypothetical protein
MHKNSGELSTVDPYANTKQHSQMTQHYYTVQKHRYQHHIANIHNTTQHNATQHNTAQHNKTRRTITFLIKRCAFHHLPRWHLGWTQIIFCFDEPLQCFPLFFGSGLSHFLVRSFFPSLQLWEQALQGVHSPQFPSILTESKRRQFC